MTGTSEQLTAPLRTSPTEVDSFVAAVREHLTDLPAVEQEELTEGLEADLADLVAEHGTGALGDPAAYADELRVAAGHVGAPHAASGDGPAGGSLRAVGVDALDAAHASWDRLLDALPADLGGLVRALQPVWWVTRGWVAWMVVQDVRSGSSAITVTPAWIVLLVVTVVLSIQLGRRTWGTGRLLSGSLAARVLLVGLNLFAVGMAPGAADRLATHVAVSYAERVLPADAGQGPTPADVFRVSSRGVR